MPNGLATVHVTYGGTGHKFCRFHQRGLLPSPSVLPTKLMPCTSVGMMRTRGADSNRIEGLIAKPVISQCKATQSNDIKEYILHNLF